MENISTHDNPSTHDYLPSFHKSVRSTMKLVFGKTPRPFFEIEFLTDTSSHKKGERVQILSDYIEFGRDVNCYVNFGNNDDEMMVSRRHLAIVRDGEGWKLLHLSETNNTVVNDGDRCIRPNDDFKEYFLQDGDSVKLAETGPAFRFVIPKDNDTESLSKSTSRTSVFRKMLSQALAPYKRALRWTLAALLLVIAVFIIYAIVSKDKVDKLLEQQHQLEETIANLQGDYSALLNVMDSISNNHDTVIIEVSKIVTPKGNKLMPMLEALNVKKDIFLVSVDSVVYVTPSERVKLPISWNGVGFLLDDGKFVTTRANVEPWLQQPNKLIAANKDLTRYLILASMLDEYKIVAYMRASSTISNTVFTFTSEDFVANRQNDQNVTVPDATGAPTTKDDGTVLYIKAAFQNTLGSDWAYCTRTDGKRGSLGVDKDFVKSMKADQTVGTMGFPNGYGVEGTINPIPTSAKVLRSNHNGVFIYSSGTSEGNFGSPVLVEKNGKLMVIGIVSGGADNYNTAVPISNIY